jgi:hypothetical protein
LRELAVVAVPAPEIFGVIRVPSVQIDARATAAESAMEVSRLFRGACHSGAGTTTSDLTWSSESDILVITRRGSTEEDT